MNSRIHQSLKNDRKQRVIEAGEAIETALDNDDLQGAWDIAKGWYKSVTSKAPKPSRQDFEMLHQERTDLYRHVDPPGEPITVRLNAPFAIDDNPPSHEEVAEACKALRRKRAVGASGIRAEDLQRWLMWYERYHNHTDPGCDPNPWQNVLDIVDHAFRTGELPRQLTWSLLVIIPKPCGGVRGIGLLDAVWKLIEKVIDLRLAHGIQFHDALHGFRKGRGTGTAILHCRLEQEQALMKGETLYQIFLDLTKAYDTLDRERSLAIFEEYGIGPSVRSLLRNFWHALSLCPKQGGYYGRKLIDSQRGVTQGGITSAILFNIIVDAVVRGFAHRYPKISRAFYADDGRLASVDANELQASLDFITELFA